MRRHWKSYLLALSFVLLAVLALTPNLRVKASDDEHVTFTTIDPPGAIYSEANYMSPSGEIVGRYYDGSVCTLPCVADDGHNHGFLLSGGEFTTIDFPGAAFTGAVGINPQGDIVGRYDEADGRQHGYLRSGGEFTTIDFPGATLTTAFGINPRGDIVGQYRSADAKLHGYLLSGGEFTTIDFPAATSTAAWKINPAGDIAGRYTSTDGKSHVFLLSDGEFTSIDFPGAFDTAPAAIPFVGINARGDIVSNYCDGAPCTPTSHGNVHGFLVTGGKFTSIDFPGAFLTAASSVNNRGDIVGVYVDTNGQAHGFLRTP
jgi:uncharacterized membrane protein